MQTVLLVVLLIVVLALIGVVLMQRSEGGALGMGGGGGGFMTARGAANALTRTTAILGATFFALTIVLALMGRYGENLTDILNRVPEASQTQGQGGAGVLDQLGGSSGTAPAETPAAPAEPSNGVPSSQ